MTNNNSNLRKAAILIRSLDAETATGVLARLTPAEAKELRLAIQSLGAVDADERADVLAEFRRRGEEVRQEPRRDVELEVSSPTAANVPSNANTRATDRPSEYLDDAHVESQVPSLARESVQTVSIVRQLAPSTNTDRMMQPDTKPGDTGPISDGGLRVSDSQPSPPKSAIRNPPSEIKRRPPIHVDDLARFDQSALSAVLNRVDTEVLVLALVGASEALVQRITEQMSGKVAKSFRQRLHACGPTRLRDVEAAQQEVAAIAADFLDARCRDALEGGSETA